MRGGELEEKEGGITDERGGAGGERKRVLWI